jgi:hypothetical protein
MVVPNFFKLKKGIPFGRRPINFQSKRKIIVVFKRDFANF